MTELVGRTTSSSNRPSLVINASVILRRNSSSRLFRENDFKGRTARLSIDARAAALFLDDVETAYQTPTDKPTSTTTAIAAFAISDRRTEGRARSAAEPTPPLVSDSFSCSAIMVSEIVRFSTTISDML